MDNQGYKQIYVRNLTRNKVIDYYVVERAKPLAWTPDSLQDDLEQANTEGAKGGLAIYTDRPDADHERTIYRLTTNCTKLMCD